MPKLIRRMVRSAKRRIERGLRDRRTWALYTAALQRLASKDYERLSIAEIVRGAGCSVGAFYSRFSDKNAFLYMVISSSFDTLRSAGDRDLDPKPWRGVAREKVVEGIVRHVVTRMSNPTEAGTTRAALKLATMKPEALKPLHEYRASVADHAVTLLASRLSLSDAQGSIREAVQLIFSMVIDSTLQDTGPLRAGSRRMINALTGLTVSYLKMPRQGLSADNDDDDEAAKGTASADTAAKGQTVNEPGEGQIDSRGPDLQKVIGTDRVILKSRRRSRRRRHSNPPPTPFPVKNPRHVKPPGPKEAGKREARKGQGRKRRLHRI